MNDVSSYSKIGRLNVVDALRGFAVMAILLVHSVEHFIYPVYPNPSLLPDWLNILDKGVFTIIFSLFAGKAYAIFALLFGFTFYVQYTNRQMQGKDFGWRFLWRLLLLACFAMLNAAFFPGGDVLLLFSIVGIILLIFRRMGNKTVLIAAIIFLLQPVEWIHYIISLFNSSYLLPDLEVGAMYGEIAEYTKEGDFLKFFVGNITLGQKASLLWAVGAGRYFQTAGLFLLGLWLGWKKMFVISDKSISFWVKTLIICAIAFAPLYELKVILADNGATPLIKGSVGVVFDMWQKFAFTGILVASFVLLYQKDFFRKRTEKLRMYGKMSLTNYVTQSIAGAFIFFPIGLSLAPYFGFAASLVAGFIIFFLQISFSIWWMKKYKHGPLEFIWHKLTWIKMR